MDLEMLPLVHQVMADGLHEVRLPEPNATIDKKRVVNNRRFLRNGEARGVRHAAVAAGDELLERVLGVELLTPVTVFALYDLRPGEFRPAGEDVIQ
jgi:hypothetical protein